MESEFYIVNLIQGDPEACRKVARHLGLDSSLDARELIAELSNRNIFWAQRDNLFEELREMLDSRLSASEALLDQDLRVLFQSASQRLMGQMLKCPPSESVQMLFSADELATVLLDLDIGHATDLWDDSEFLLSTILEKKSKLQAAGITDLFGELNYRLRTNTRQDLSRQLKCDEEEVLEHLIRHLKGVVTPENSAPALVGGAEYDIISISKLRNFLHEFRERLLREAVLEASKARGRLPGHRAPAVLGGLIEYCVSGNYKSGLTELLSPHQFLREVLPEKLSDARADAGLIQLKFAPIELPRGASKNSPSTESHGVREFRAEILYRSSANSQPLAVLKIERLTRAEVEQIEAHLPKSCDKLSPVGANLYERILNTAIPIFSRWRRTLYDILKHDAAEGMHESFVQCFVLSGVSFDTASLAPGLRSPQTTRTEENAPRVEFPKGTTEMAAEIEEDYRSKGRHVRWVGSTPQSAR